MRDLLENKEIFEHYIRIDGYYYMLNEIKAQLNKPLSNLEKMIDESTGYGQERVKILSKQSYELITAIIFHKRAIEADYSRDEKMLKEISKHINT